MAVNSSHLINLGGKAWPPNSGPMCMGVWVWGGGVCGP